MHTINTYLRPSATSHAVKCRLGEELLVVARVNRLDAYELLPDGIRLLTSLDLLPRIVALHEIKPDDEPGVLLVITDHPDCSALIVEYSTKNQTLSVRSSSRLVSAYGLPLSGCTTSCVISPDGLLAAVALYQGIVHLLSFSRKKGAVVISSKTECPIREVLLNSYCFVPYTNNTIALALLHQKHTGEQQLTIRSIIAEDDDPNSKEISSEAIKIDIQDTDIEGLIPVPVHEGGTGGVLLHGGESLLYYELRGTDEKRESPKRRRTSTSTRSAELSVEWSYSLITAYGFIDHDRLLLSDQYGKLVLLSFGRSDKNRVRQLNLHLLGETSSAKCLTYLNAGVLFLGSENGDSHLVRLSHTGDMDVLDTFQNVAPITDAILADLDNSGEPVVVTCSGAGRTGSLRVIRTGANVLELGTISGVDEIKDVFPLSDTNGPHSHILLSFEKETRLVHAQGVDQFTEIPESEYPGAIRSFSTIAAANVVDKGGEVTNLAVQVTNVAAILFDVQSGMQYQRWQGSITVASVSGNCVCLGIKGGRVVTLAVDVEQAKFTEKADVDFHNEVSVVSIYHSPPILVFVGLWEEHMIGMYHFDTLQAVTGGTDIEVPHVPRSILAWSFGSGRHSQVYLLVGTGNGQLVSLKLNGKGGTVDMSTRRSTSLGDRPVHLRQCIVDGREVVMATGSRTILLSSQNHQVMHHHVGVKNLQSVIEFNTTSFPGSLIFNLPSGLMIAKIGRLEKLKIDTIPFGFDVPISVAYHHDVNAFAVGCVRTEPSRPGEPDNITSSFKLIDALTLEHLNSYTLRASEEVTKVITATLSVNGEARDYIVVGTAIWEDDGTEPSKGRILLFRTQRGKPKKAAMNPPTPDVLLSMDEEIRGSVVSMAELDGKLAVIVNTILIVYAVQENSITENLELKAVDEWVHSYGLSSIVVNIPGVFVGDSLQSVTHLTWSKKEQKLKYVARDWSTVNSMNLSADEEAIIQSDIDGNITSFDVNTPGDKLQQTGSFFFGETVSQIIPGSLRTSGESYQPLVTPKHLLFTSGGRISIISQCDESRAMLLHNVQRNMSAAFKQDHYDVLAWRVPRIRNKIADELTQSFGFVDGDLLSRFLELESTSLKTKTAIQGTKSAERLELDYGQLRRLIEELQIAQ